MEHVLRADPDFTNFQPRTAADAVCRFTRCQRQGLKSIMIPECLIECSRHLPERELDLFEEWIMNPGGHDFSRAVPDDSIRAHNERVWRGIEASHGETVSPPEEDEKQAEPLPAPPS